MSPRAAAAAVARSAGVTIHAPARTRTGSRPAPARRRSGAVARPRTAVRPDFTTVLDRVLRGPAYIALVFVLLAGIVFFNVDVLELNRGVAQTDKRAADLKRENAALTLEVAKLGSSERIQRVALQRGLVLPQPGDVRYLRTGRQDAARALRVMTAPDSSGAVAVVPAVTQGGEAVTQAPQTQVTPQTTTPTQPTTQATAPAQAAPQPTQQTTPQQTTPQQTTPQQATPPATTQAGATAAPTTTTTP